ncbi:chloramphenicol-sensitive protein RarD [Devosia enhydra]|uniref:Chloramphenicol-sensitive protein RarD n=1 Tax=Devosia enhydra TaxID=665118 RepID=A0A1K2HVR2_9HYPH|nr:EamA family transporter RarD [Devosia enhydra]SFZ82924.1 chloramphenicol-sensitive protein RarD [Devosia enhydra]
MNIEASKDRTLRSETVLGLFAALAAYFQWGFLSLLFNALEHVPPLLVVAYRTLFSLVFVGAILIASRRMREVVAAIADRQTLRQMALSAVLLAINWSIFCYAVVNGQALEAAFGYFINPMLNVAIGMVLLGERNNRMQGIAIAIALIALAIQAAGLGGVPYIALGLAGSFAFYAYFRKTAKVASTPGLFVETLVLAPVALLFILYSAATDGVGAYDDGLSIGLLLLTGPATALPLLCFAYGVQRLRLITIGMLQYLGPTLQFIIAITVFGETLNGLRLLSFGLIWLSLGVYTADSIRRVRKTTAGGAT